MSAPTPASGEDRPREGYYPDPSIPGYVRYWDGVSWVPGTSRPAPTDGTPLPPPPGVHPAAQETGPLFFDEDPASAGRQQNGPATSALPQQSAPGGWGSGPSGPQSPPPGGQFGAPGSSEDRSPGTGQPLPGRDEERPDGTVTMRAVRPGVPGPAAPRDDAPAGAAPAEDGDVPADGTVTMRALGPGARRPALPGPSGQGKPVEGTVVFRRPETPGRGAGAPGSAGGGSAPAAGQAWGTPGQAPAAPGQDTGTGGGAPHQDRGAAHQGTPGREGTPGRDGAAAREGRAERPGEGTMAIRMPRPPAQESPGTPTAPHWGAAPAAFPHPAAPGSTPGAAPSGWPQQPGPAGHGGPGGPGGAGGPGAPSAPGRVAGPGGAEPPVVPWKPPVEDPFLAAAQEQASGRPAAIGKRFAARLIDTVVVGGLTALVAVPLGSRAADHIDDKIDEAKLSGETVTVWLLDGTTSVSLALVLGALLLAGLLFEVLPTAKWGRTLGKRLCGLDVRDIEAHQPPGFGSAVRRWLVFTVPGLLLIGVVGVVWCLFDRPWRQCWHDKAARTFVAG
ncbi:RDD family protein [Streptomyces physcomitrii]|uniref:DUF2510 domain-containing protein n=1 Tax=Streptomyces physcomitrii TaxID=2724184 RepID=A0ABX1GUK1_9ACTN|nr:RDD family protein [Streptomyces physcomitrii]NKI39747.1 DUF2510 domain-containing protein [Streptomyces physcomitrii]